MVDDLLSGPVPGSLIDQNTNQAECGNVLNNDYFAQNFWVRWFVSYGLDLK